MAQILLLADWMTETEDEIFCVYGPEDEYFKEAIKEGGYIDERADDKWALVDVPDEFLLEFEEVSNRYWALQGRLGELFEARRDELWPGRRNILPKEGA